MTRLVFLDTETTSLDDTRGEVWEIAAIVRDADGDTEHLWQVQPDLSTASPDSLRINRFYERCRVAFGNWSDRGALRMPTDGSEPDSMLDVRTPKQVAANLAALLDGAHVVGAVPDFDYRFLRRFLTKHGQCWAAHYHLIDVEALAVGYVHGLIARTVEQLASEGRPHDALRKLPDTVASLPWKSTSLYTSVRVDPSDYEAHTALGDARLVRAVYDAVTGGGADA